MGERIGVHARDVVHAGRAVPRQDEVEIERLDRHSAPATQASEGR